MHRQPSGAHDACVNIQRWFTRLRASSPASRPWQGHAGQCQRQWQRAHTRRFTISTTLTKESDRPSDSTTKPIVTGRGLDSTDGRRSQKLDNKPAQSSFDALEKQLGKSERRRSPNYDLYAPRGSSATTVEQLLAPQHRNGQELDRHEDFRLRTWKSKKRREVEDKKPQVGSSDPTSGFRDLLASMTNSVVVLTAREPSDGATDRADYSGMHGVTLSSFATVTMQPQPYISFNISSRSRTLAAFLKQKSPRICVHLLSGNEDGARIAHSFTQKYDRPEEPFAKLAGNGAAITEPYDVPRIQQNQGVMAWLTCSADDDCVLRTVGDHHICLFRVDKWETADHVSKSSRGASRTLSYHDRSYVKALNVPIRGRDEDSRPSTEQPPDGHSAGLGSIASTDETASPQRSQQDAAYHQHSDQDTSRPYADAAKGESEPVTVDPALLKETVGDFLAHDKEAFIMRLQRYNIFSKQAHQAWEELEVHKQQGTLTESIRRDLEDIITDRNRFLARGMAWLAAMDLNLMLDRGHVSRSRVQYLEKAIERGQAVLNAEGRDLQHCLNTWGPGSETKLVNRERLLYEEDLFRTALARLRDYADEDEGTGFLDDDD